mgnify:CR=1 FL=1
MERQSRREDAKHRVIRTNSSTQPRPHILHGITINPQDPVSKTAKNKPILRTKRQSILANKDKGAKNSWNKHKAKTKQLLILIIIGNKQERWQ